MRHSIMDTGCKLVRKFSLSVEIVRHIWQETNLRGQTRQEAIYHVQ